MKSIKVLSALCVGSTVLGGILAAVQIQFAQYKANESNEDWSTVRERQIVDEGATFSTLVSSSHFRGVQRETEEDAKQRGSEDGEQNAPPPIILASSLVDNSVQVTVKAEDGAIENLGVGDKLPSGWSVVSADLNSVLLSNNDDEVEISLFEQLENN